MSKLKIRHDLHTLSQDEAAQYLRDVSEFLEIDADLNAFDLIFMPNPTGQGQTLCVYARRGTCELLRDKHEIEVLDQAENVVEGSYVVRVKGRNGKGRLEIALGSRSIEGLKGRDRDDAIMTASTRALQRLTMQFTGLGILSESEVVSVTGQPVNPAADAKLAGSSMVIPPMPSVAANNAPGKPVEPQISPELAQAAKAVLASSEVANAKIGNEADIKADTTTPAATTTPAESTTSEVSKADTEPAKTSAKKPRKTKTVTLDVEPEVVNNAPKVDNSPAAAVSTSAETAPKTETVPTQANSAVPAQVNSVPSSPSAPPPSTPVPVSASTDIPQSQPSATPAGMPSVEQMADYRLRVSMFTKELPPSKNGEYGSVQRMRAFITRWNNGTPPASMSVAQWEAQIAWFNEFATKNSIKGLIAYIGDYLGDNK